jgi:hypothetical protein
MLTIKLTTIFAALSTLLIALIDSRFICNCCAAAFRQFGAFAVEAASFTSKQRNVLSN